MYSGECLKRIDDQLAQSDGRTSDHTNRAQRSRHWGLERVREHYGTSSAL